MIKRKLEVTARKILEKMPVLTITGCRQSGKTTFVKDVFSDFKYVNFENPDILDFARSDPRGFLNSHGTKLIIDEAQKFPELFSYIQTYVDDSKDNIKFILTGSQNFQLNQAISQSLAGRAAILYLMPFCLEELKGTEFKEKEISSHILKGMYPRIYDKLLSPQEWYPDYITAYIERDVRTLSKIADLNLFRKFVRLCANRTGKPLNVTSLASECGITRITANSWLSILEASFLIFFLEPFYENYNKRIVKTPKLYFYDTGLLCALIGITSLDAYEYSYLKGSIFESFIISEIKKRIFHSRLPHKLYFWQDKSGNEIDLILENGNKKTAVEIKASETPDTNWVKTIHKWTELSEKNKTTSYVIYGGQEDHVLKASKIKSWKNLDELLI